MYHTPVVPNKTNAFVIFGKLDEYDHIEDCVLYNLNFNNILCVQLNAYPLQVRRIGAKIKVVMQDAIANSDWLSAETKETLNRKVSKDIIIMQSILASS